MRYLFIAALSTVALWSGPLLADAPLRAASTPAGQPASGLDASGKWEGIAVELLTEMLKPRPVDFVPMNFSDLQGALTGSNVDVIAASFGITPERARVVNFTKPHGSYRDVLLIPESDNNAYAFLSDLKGKRIATSRGSAYVKPLEDAGVNLLQVANPVEAIADLRAGRVVGVVDNGLQLRYRLKQMRLTGFKIIDAYKPIAEGKLAFAVRKDASDLLSKLDAALDKAEQDGVLQNLKEKWSVD